MEVINSPANLSYIPSSVQLLTPPLKAKRKCTPSQPLQDSTTNTYEPNSNYATVFGMSEEELPSATTISDLLVPDFSVAYYTSVVLHSNRDTTLPFNAHLGHIRPITNSDKTVFAEAAKDTSEQLVNSRETYLYCQQANQNTEQTQAISEHTIKQKQPRPWTIEGQNQELRAVGLDSSYLSQFVFDSFDNTGNSLEFPPTETPVFSPNSPEYLEKVYEALGINTDTYAHLDPALKDKFKELIRKYSSVFWLPGAPLGTIHGFEHNIPTGDATPIHHLPYRKSPSELQAIKEEIQRMLQLSIIIISLFVITPLQVLAIQRKKRKKNSQGTHYKVQGHKTTYSVN